MSFAILDSRDRVPAAYRGAVIALGNFDGFHGGHQRVVAEAIACARAEGRPAIVATFDPHPVRFFRPESPPFRLTSIAQRARLFEAAGADAMMLFHFDAIFAANTAEDFVIRLLYHRFGAAAVVTGEDFTFGKGRGGNFTALVEMSARAGITARAVGPVRADGAVISSSRIRAALQAGDLGTANALLTRPFAIEGVVEHGDKNGRKLGFPTANVGMGDYVRPRYGIYAVTGRLADGHVLQGAANIGIRPTFNPPRELLEPYFFDFDGDLYGQTIEVAFHAFIRPEAKFDTLDALTAQMARDCEEARARLSALAP